MNAAHGGGHGRGLPGFAPIRNSSELRGLCCRSCFGPRTCGRSITNSSKRVGALNQGFPFSPIQCRHGARELMAPLFMGDDEELQALIRDHLILPYLFEDFHPSHIQEYAGGLLFALEKPAKDGGVSGPSSAAKAGVAVAPASLPTLSGDLSLIFLHPHTKTFYKLQVSRMAFPTAPRFFLPCTPHLTLTPLTPT